MKFTVGRATPRDLAEILRLVGTQYGSPYNQAAYWKWRYFENPVADARVYVVRSSKGDIVAMQPASGYALRNDGGTEMAYLLTAAITDPAYRRRGFFRDLVERIVGDLSDQGVRRLFTFPNKTSIQAFQRFPGWREQQTLSLSVRPALMPSLPGRKGQNGLPTSSEGQHSIAYETISSADFLAGAEDIWQERQHHLLFIDRGKEYLRWRYSNAPFANYNVLQVQHRGKYKGYLVLRQRTIKGLRIGLVVDLVAADAPAAHALIEAATREARTQKLLALGFLASCPDLFGDGLRSLGFFRWPDGLLNRKFCVYAYDFRTEKSRTGLPEREKQWHITWGDTDVV